MNKNIKAFTLIELMVVFSIIVLLIIGVYSPYSYYGNKAKLKIGKKQIAKTIYEARNTAIYGLNEKKNRSIGVYFDSLNNKNKILIYSYPYDFSGLKNDFSNINVKLVKEIKLEPNIWINKINGVDNALFYFNAISGSGSYYYFNPSGNEFLSDKIKINFSFKNGKANLASNVIYFTKTNIVDY